MLECDIPILSFVFGDIEKKTRCVCVCVFGTHTGNTGYRSMTLVLITRQHGRPKRPVEVTFSVPFLNTGPDVYTGSGAII